MGPEEHIEQDDRLTSNMSRGTLHKNGLRTTVKGRLSEWPKKQTQLYTGCKKNEL